jgi:hypothetical protein
MGAFLYGPAARLQEPAGVEDGGRIERLLQAPVYRRQRPRIGIKNAFIAHPISASSYKTRSTTTDLQGQRA